MNPRKERKRTIDEARPRHASFADFYQHSAYARYVRGVTGIGTTGASLVRIGQPAGDYPDAATPDFVFSTSFASSRITADLGDGRVRTQARRGWMVVAPADRDSAITIDDPSEFIALAVPRTHIADCLASSGWRGDFRHLHSPNGREAALAAMIEALWELSSATEKPPTLAFEAMLTAFLHLAWSRAQRSTPRQPPERLTTRQIRIIEDYLAANLARDVSLAELQAISGLSRFHLCRAFKAETGITLHRYHVALRMARARELISGGRLTISEVSVAIGYDDPSYFARIFSREAGCSPGIWRQINAKCASGASSASA